MTDIPNPWLPESVAPLPADQLAAASTGAAADLLLESQNENLQDMQGNAAVRGVSHSTMERRILGDMPGLLQHQGGTEETTVRENRPGKGEGQISVTDLGLRGAHQEAGQLREMPLPNPETSSGRTSRGLFEGPSSEVAMPKMPWPGASNLDPSSDPSVTLDSGAGEAFRVPPGYVLIPQPNFDRMMELIVELQAEREADRIDHADYERLREKERVELLTPPPSFLKRQDFARAMERDAA